MGIKPNNQGLTMLKWMKDIWNFPRSLTGHGTHATLEYLRQINKDLTIHQIKSGTKVFDWEIPDEWNIYDAYIEHESGKRFAEFSKSNLHVLGYSTPCNTKVSLVELLRHIYTQPDQPNVIPYVTSYYKERWGFCMSENDKRSLPKGKYHVVIDAKKGPGVLEIADLVIKGKNSKEIFFSTYICHPSMANNELSGPVLSSALIQYIKSKYPNPIYSYRFVFAPETIGSITYLSEHLKNLQEKVVCGFTLSCVGDERAYSHIESRMGNSLADKALQASLIDLDNVVAYTFLERGSDERQYCAPGVDIPLCGFSRTKYGEYPEYHTSLDNLESVVTPQGLNGGYWAIRRAIEAVERNKKFKVTILCEPQMGKRGLYPTLSTKNSGKEVRLMMNFISLCDGESSLLEIAEKLNVPIWDLYEMVEKLENNNLISAN